MTPSTQATLKNIESHPIVRLKVSELMDLYPVESLELWDCLWLSVGRISIESVPGFDSGECDG
jgi:hypothetical protein